ncbi:hypothetical protein [Halomarina oriensis]|uniref:Small CPxCG-related zinc finger protein n=1 Tax=Halomarina oriensis TaxID=671145 RepID=A0A6B0GLL1_9EURY|nr:hypothetical protein [Halomarina oriensis]MWG33015.1 hypothetical protein [Halomarina oriensis]
MSVRVRVACPGCSASVTAQPGEPRGDDTLHGRSVPCEDCGHRIDLYYY